MTEVSSASSKVVYGSHGKIPKEFVDGENNIVKMVFTIHDFAKLQEKRGESICTTNVNAFGDLWKLQVFPRGSNKSKADTESVLISLVYDGKNTDADPVVVKAVFRTKTGYGEMPRIEFSTGAKKWANCWYNWGTREDMIKNDCDDAGTLTITVELQAATEKRSVWFPQLKYCDNIIGTQLYRSMKQSDVSFIVGDSKIELRGHTCIIGLRAPSLSQLIETEKESSSNNEDDDRSETQLVLHDIDVMDFTEVLEFMYTDKVPTTWKKKDGGGDIEKAKSLLRVADRLGCTDFKLYMESTLVETFLVPSTAADLLVLADSFNCALLKEKTMMLFMTDSKSFMVSNPDEWKKVQESSKLLTELLVHATSDRKEYSSIVVDDDGNINGTPEEADGLDITSLRERLQKVDLDVDGSREILVDRWKNYLFRAINDNDKEEEAEEDGDDDDEA